MRNRLFAIFLLFFTILFSSTVYSKGPGDKVDDFTLKSVNGMEFNLSTALAENNYVVVMFWSTECPFVQPYTERINSIVNDYSSNGIAFWGVNSNSTESLENVKSHADDKDYAFPMLKDVNNVVADIFGATRTPEVYLIDNNKTILYHGRIDDNRDADKVTTNDLINALNETIDGKNITNNNTKFFGCTIKRVDK